jgi:hypothetical protein
MGMSPQWRNSVLPVETPSQDAFSLICRRGDKWVLNEYVRVVARLARRQDDPLELMELKLKLRDRLIARVGRAHRRLVWELESLTSRVELSKTEPHDLIQALAEKYNQVLNQFRGAVVVTLYPRKPPS